MTKKENKKDKKKLLVLALLLFAVVGLAGYGVYSYYWTQGDFGASSNDISVSSFDPETIINGSENFLGSGGSVSLSCPDNNGKETVTCTGSIDVHNNGGTSVDVQVLEASADYYSNGGDLTPSVGNPRFRWSDDSSSSTRIYSGEYETLNISVDYSVDNGTTNGLDSSEAEEVSGPVPGGSFRIDVGFKLKATQVRD